jgi:hypothetical protein
MENIFICDFDSGSPDDGSNKARTTCREMGAQPATSTVEPVDRLPNRLDIEVPVDEFAPSLPEVCSALNSS